MRHLRLAVLSPLAAVLRLSAGEPAATPEVAAAPQPSVMHAQLLEDVRILAADDMQGRADAIKEVLAYVSVDRKRYGLVLGMDITKNTTLAALNKVVKLNVIDQALEVKSATDITEKMKLKAPSLEARVGQLSGGNQQKVVLSKWLLNNPKILVLDEPTRGIDVGAKYEIYKIINELVQQGVGIVIISSELPEVLGMSDRVLVMAEGEISGEFLREEATQEKIMTCATGGKKNEYSTSNS